MLAKIRSWTIANVPVLLRDLAGIAGAASISYGAWLIMPACGFIVGGILLLIGVIILSRKN